MAKKKKRKIRKPLSEEEYHQARRLNLKEQKRRYGRGRTLGPLPKSPVRTNKDLKRKYRGTRKK